ncbi:UNVERIFIED_CONTAM: hypothetical protein K2H54_039397 [Gekko kuhli]
MCCFEAGHLPSSVAIMSGSILSTLILLYGKTDLIGRTLPAVCFLLLTFAYLLQCSALRSTLLHVTGTYSLRMTPTSTQPFAPFLCPYVSPSRGVDIMLPSLFMSVMITLIWV